MSRNAQYFFGFSPCLLAAALLGGVFGGRAQAAAPPSPGSPADPETRARVVVVSDHRATEAFRAQPEIIRDMVNRAITNFTETASVRKAWLTLVKTQDVVGLKVYSPPGPNCGTRPSVAAAVIEGLLAAGVPSNHIVIWDSSVADLRLAGYGDLAAHYGVRVQGSEQAGYDEKVYYDSSVIGNLVWGDHEFGKRGPGVGRKSFVSLLVTLQLTKIINITPLLNHTVAGVSGNLYSLSMGSVDNVVRFENDPRLLAEAVPDIYNLPEINEKVVLNIVDALICQYEGGERGLLHYSAVLNELRFSKDPVALDVLSINELDRRRRTAAAPVVRPNLDLYGNAGELLGLGVSQIKRIDVERLK